MVGYTSTSTNYYDSGTTGAWTVWCTSSCTNSTTTTSSNNAWVSWVTDDSTTSTSTTTGTTWSTWNSVSTNNAPPATNSWRAVRREETEEERAERERRTEERRLRLEEERKIREEAHERAEKLLLGFLDRKQRKDWVKGGRFYLYSGKKRYRIKRGRAGNVELVDRKGEVLERYCCHPVQHVPEADCALSQMLALQYNEEHFLKLANVHHRAPGFNRAEYERRLAA